MKDYTPLEAARIAQALRGMHWKDLVTMLKSTAAKETLAEMPTLVRRWLEANRAARGAVAVEETKRELAAIMDEMKARYAGGPDPWLGNTATTAPVSGWIVSAWRFLRDGEIWWLFSARRHDDENASLVGKIVPCAATKADLKKLEKILKFAGGDPKRPLLFTGPLTQEERDELLAEGLADVADFGEVFYWWKART